MLKNLMNIKRFRKNLPELQGNPEEIAKNKCLSAFKIAKQPIFCEDTSLCFNGLKGLPGPYIKWFLESLGHEGLNNMLVGFEDKSAYAQCILSYMEDGLDEPLLFIGKCDGKIVDAQGPKNFGWDPIFLPDGYNQTYAELPSDIKNTISHRFKATEKFMHFLETRDNKKQKLN